MLSLDHLRLGHWLERVVHNSLAYFMNDLLRCSQCFFSAIATSL